METIQRALFVAIDRDLNRMTEILLATGIHPAVTNEKGENMFHRCALRGDNYMMNLLLTEGQKACKDEAEFTSIINSKCKKGCTPLSILTAGGTFYRVYRKDCIELLLKNGADVNSVPSGLQNPFLFQAVCEINVDAGTNH